MNKIYKVIYSKVKQCYIVVSELAKSHVKSSHGSNGQQKAALTMSVLLALGAFTFAFGPVNAEAATSTEGKDFIGVEHDSSEEATSSANYQGGIGNHNQGAKGANSITIGVNAEAGDGTIAIGDRRASVSKGSVYVGQGDIAKPKSDSGAWVTSVGYNSDVTGYGSIAIGSNAVAKNSYDKDASGNGIQYSQTYTGTDGKSHIVLNANPGIQRASVALGYGASADNGNIAIGSYSDASTDLRTQTDDKYKSYLTGNKANSYISVGSSTELRRVSNVADGALDTDAATIAQLKQAVKDTDASKKANITADNIGTKMTVYTTDSKTGKTVEETDKTKINSARTENENAWGTAIGTGKVANPTEVKDGTTVTNDPTTNGSQQLVTGGTVYNAIQDAIQNQTAWNLSTNKNTSDNANETTTKSSAAIKPGTTVDFSADVDGNDGTNNHHNIIISQDSNSSDIKLKLDNNIVIGEKKDKKGGSLSVYRDPGTDPASADKQDKDQLGSHVLLDGSTVSVRYTQDGSERRGVVLGVSEDIVTEKNADGSVKKDEKGNPVETKYPYGYISFNNGQYYLHGATAGESSEKDYQQRLVYDGPSGHEYIANLNDGIKFSGDTKDSNGKAVTVDTKLDSSETNNTLNITGGADSKNLSSGNIGVVATANTTNDTTGEVTQAGGLTIQLAKDLKGITSISNQKITKGSNNQDVTTGTKIELGDKGITISGGDVNVSSHKITGLADGSADTDAATVGQMNTAIGNAKTKYYSVKEGIQLGGFKTNADNDGADASNIAGMAAGFETGTTGIASTVAGSYSGVIGSGLQGAAAVSVGTVNVNNNTDTNKAYSGVANSIVGQANMTTDSNAAIIVGAGNSVTNSYRDLDKDALTAIKSAVAKQDANALKKALQDAVPTSGAQVMVMGGGNSVDKAYMTQVVGVGNKVTGNDTTYAEGTSTQYNYIDGFRNELTNGKNDYIIGSNNKVNGTSVDKNKSNLVLGDNHTLNDQMNNVILGSADNEQETKASNAVIIGHNADVQKDDGVAIGSDSVASVDKGEEGYDATTLTKSTDTTGTWKATNAAVSVGKANGSLTRQITGVAAGTADTDAVNVAQIKKLASINASNIGANLKGSDGKTTASTDEIRENEDAWAAAIGTGKVADSKASDASTNGSKQLVTGGEVYDALHGGLDNITVGKDGKDGKDGSIGIAGKDGANGYSITTIKTEQGKPGVDGKDGITRIVYQKDGSTDKETVATLDDGMKFAGDDGQKDATKAIAKKLDETLNISGGADSTKLTEGNIGVNSDGTGLKIQLAQNLTGITSIANQTTTKDKDNNDVTTGAKIDLNTDGSISVNNGKITNVASSLTKGTDGKYTVADADKNNAANISDVQNLVKEATDSANTGLAGKANITADNIGANLKGSDGKTAASEDEIRENTDAWAAAIGTGKVADPTRTDSNDPTKNGSQQLVTGGEVYNALHGGLDNITVGKDGKDGTPGKDGSIGIIGQTGAKGEDGKNAFATTIIKTERGVDGVDGKNGKDGITRVVYQDGTTKRTFATLDDGLKFAGDDGQKDSKKVIAKKLDEQLNITGGADSTKLTEGNIGVNSDGTGLKIQLAQNLAGITSIANQTTADGKTTGAKITLNTDGSIDFNGGKITNIASNATKGADGKYTVADADKNNAASMSDVQNLVKDATDSADAGLAEKANIKADNIGANLKGSDGKAKASTDEIRANEDAWAAAIGTGKVADSKATDANTNGSKQLVTGGEVYSALHGGLENITVGKDGKDGTPGKDGSIGIIGQTGAKGDDGKNAYATTIIKTEQGAAGVDGKTITRVVYQDEDGTNKHTLATLDDGLKFAGDDGQKDSKKVIAKKLDEQLNITGGADSTKLTEGNIGVNSYGTGLKIQLAQNLAGITSISNQITTDGETTGAKITLNTDGSTDFNGGKITNIANGLTTTDGSYNQNDANNAANISDVNSMISKAVQDAKTETQTNLDGKANTDASNIGSNIKVYQKDATGKVIIGTDGQPVIDQKATEEAQKANKDSWGKAIGTNEVKEGNSQLVTSDAVAKELDKKADKNSVYTKDETYNRTEIDSRISSISADVNGKANTSLNNITPDGQNVIKDQAQSAVKISETGLNTSVVATPDKTNHTTTYTVNVEGNGKVADKDTGLISGGTLYNELRPDKDGSYIKQSNTTALNLTNLDTQVKKTSDLINSDTKTIKIGGSDTATKVDVSGKDGQSRVITGVKTDANDSTSAASVGYVNDMNAANTQQIYHDMNSAYNHVENDISRAAAGSNALAALHPMEFDPDDKAQYALGYGHYRNSNAGAVGVFYQPDENSMFSLGASFGNGDAGINAGVTVKFGPGGSGHHALTKTQMAKVINEQSQEIDTLKKENADKDKRIDALEQKVNEILAKVEKDKG